jgi:DNA polymerase elongation subunit (family B)
MDSSTKPLPKDFILASDTDSVYLCFKELVDKFITDGRSTREVIQYLDSVCKDILQPEINKSFEKLAYKMNAFQQKMFMKREIIADRMIIIGGKNYILNIWNKEGIEYDEPKIKISGLAAVKSNTPAICRTKIKDAIKIILEKDQDVVVDFISAFKEEFRELSAEDIGKPSQCNNVDTYMEGNGCRKGTPFHVRGAIVYNQMLKEMDLEKEYDTIKSGEKIKSIYLKTPNRAKCYVISFHDILPKEFDLHRYIDYNEQFKSFLNPMETILESIGWRTKPKSSLMDF